MARVVRFHKAGGPEVLRLEEVDLPLPGAGEVQIRVHALCLNRAKAMFRSGTYLYEPQFPARLGYEAAGTVEVVGEGVKDYKPGDAVSVVPSFSMNKYGVYGNVATVPDSALARHPASLSWTEAAAKEALLAETRLTVVVLSKPRPASVNVILAPLPA